MIRLTRRLFFIATIWIVAVASLEVTLRCVYFQSKASEISAIKLFSVRSIDRIRRGFGKVGVELNREGWKQSFTERGLPVPPRGAT